MASTWLSILGSIFYYITLPITMLFSWLLVLFAPVLHVGRFFLAGCLLPITLLAKLEAIYVFLGVAAVLGIFAGSILHLTSTVIGSLFALNHSPESPGRTAASVRAARKNDKEKTRLTEAYLDPTGMGLDKAWRDDIPMEKYGEWLEQKSTQKGYGVAGQTILEEEDDSMDGF